MCYYLIDDCLAHQSKKPLMQGQFLFLFTFVPLALGMVLGTVGAQEK